MSPTFECSSSGLLVKVDDVISGIIRPDVGGSGRLSLGVCELGVFRVPGELGSFIHHIEVHLPHQQPSRAL